MKNLINVLRNNEELVNINTTDNRNIYNKLHKIDVCKCSHCPYHEHENLDHKIYGGRSDKDLKYPNWKLISKNSKQYQKKNLKLEYTPFKYHDYGWIYINI